MTPSAFHWIHTHTHLEIWMKKRKHFLEKFISLTKYIVTEQHHQPPSSPSPPPMKEREWRGWFSVRALWTWLSYEIDAMISLWNRILYIGRWWVTAVGENLLDLTWLFKGWNSNINTVHTVFYWIWVFLSEKNESSRSGLSNSRQTYRKFQQFSASYIVKVFSLHLSIAFRFFSITVTEWLSFHFNGTRSLLVVQRHIVRFVKVG